MRTPTDDDAPDLDEPDVPEGEYRPPPVGVPGARAVGADHSRSVSDLVVERLRAWGVPRVFGYSGDGINAVLGALRRAGGDPAFVQARHEETAAFMAVGHAKYTGGVGVVTRDPGARRRAPAQRPLRRQARQSAGRRHSSGSRSARRSGPTTSRRSTCRRCSGRRARSSRRWRRRAEQVPMLLDRAFRTALATRSPCVVILPHDVQKLPAPGRSAREHGVMVTTPGWRSATRGAARRRPPRSPPRCSTPASGSRCSSGQGARGAQDEVVAVAERARRGHHDEPARQAVRRRVAPVRGRHDGPPRHDRQRAT